jgi:hypothetical protein
MEEFQIRKIRWAIEEMQRQGKEITLWNLTEMAGVKPQYMIRISGEMQKILKDKGIILT